MNKETAKEIVNKKDVKMGELLDFTKYVDTCINQLLTSKDGKFAETTACGISALVDYVLNAILSENSPILDMKDSKLIYNTMSDEELQEFLTIIPEIASKNELMPNRVKSTKNAFYLGTVADEENTDGEKAVIPQIVILEEHYELDGSFSKVFLHMLDAATDLGEMDTELVSTLRFIIEVLNITLSGMETVYASAIYATLSSDDCVMESVLFADDEDDTTHPDENDDSMK